MQINQFCIYGASGHGKVIADSILNDSNEIIAFLDDAPKENSWEEIPILPAMQFGSFSSFFFVIGIGKNETRKVIAEKLQHINFGVVAHPSSIISKTSRIAEGTVLLALSLINSDVNIGKHCIINSKASVDHDCLIGDFVHVAPNATLCGNVQVGEGTFVGAGSVVIPNITIGKWCVIGAGAVVLKDVPDYCTVVGNPGRIIKMSC
jgi:sugar O-acyltransferase (sialic acid O-acetyltransferase NeuD family)